MYFGYTLIKDSVKGDKVDLALFSDKPGGAPIPIYTLPYTECAVCFFSQEEAFTVMPSEDSGLIIQPQRPGRIYLTPNRSERPGFSVNRIKITKSPDGKIVCQFDREKGWEEFNPSTKEY